MRKVFKMNSPETEIFTKKIKSIFSKNTQLAKKIKSEKNFKRENYKKLAISEVLKFHPRNESFFKEIYPFFDGSVLNETIICDDLFLKIMEK